MKHFVISLIAVAVMSVGADAGEVVLDVSEDTWIEGLDSPVPGGADSALGICPAAEYWIYLKFDLANVPGEVAAAELRLTRIGGSRPEEISAYLITDDSWNEATLSGVNRPSPMSPPNSNALAIGAAQTGYDRWQSMALTETVATEALGDGTITLMLRENLTGQFDVRTYRSREAAAPANQKPRLVVTCSTVEVFEVIATSGAPATYSWNPGSATRWDVVSGSLSDLHADANVQAASCVADDLTESSYADPRPDPLPGEGQYFLIRGTSGCGAGSYGSPTVGPARVPSVDCL